MNPITYTTISNFATKMGIKAPSAQMVKSMTQAQLKTWMKHASRAQKSNIKTFRGVSRTARRNAKQEINSKLAEKRMVHSTVRQAVAQATGLTAQTLAGTTGGNLISAIKQNTDGGAVKPAIDDSTITENGPVYAPSKQGRDED